MKMTFRWYGKDDPVKLEYIKQIPGMKGIITAIYDIPVGEVWPLDKIIAIKETVEKHGLELSGIESVPVHEDIKLGLPTRDKYIDNYIQTIRNIAEAGINLICYNFMPVFDWTRSNLEYVNEDASTSLIFEQDKIKKMDPALGELELPGWDVSYAEGGLGYLLDQYKDIDEEKLWGNLEYFIKRIMPVCEEVRVKMAIHPDDPPWSIFGLPRIITSYENLERFLNIYDSPYNGLTLCTGSLGCTKENDIVNLIKYFGKERNRIHFAHIRNVKIENDGSFKETAHPTEYGSMDMYQIIKAYLDYDFDGPYRPDHGRMIWGEKGKAGYGLYDRALGAVYIHGLIEAITKEK